MKALNLRTPLYMQGNFFIEFRREKNGSYEILNEKLDTFTAAQNCRDKLLNKGFHEIIIKKNNNQHK